MNQIRFRKTMACAAVLFGFASSAFAQTLSMRFDNGRISLYARNAPIEMILAEWARVGGTRIVNGNRVGGAPVTLELNGVPERQALEILLRGVAGYVITARDATSSGYSAFGGVVILAKSSAPRTPAPVIASSATIPPRPVELHNDMEDGNPAPRAAPLPPTFGNPAMEVTGITSVGPGAGQKPAQVPAKTLQTLPGSSRPGEITPPPQRQPNQR